MNALWLIGMMGSGKTAVGETVARLRGIPFVDTDRRIESETQRAISAIWDSAGEEAFRVLEADQIARVVEEGIECVVATGGGAILDPINRRLLSNNGMVIWLTAGVDVLSRRVADNQTRPLLKAPDVAGRLRQILAERAHWYTETADHEIDTTARSVDEVAREVIRLWNDS